MSGMCVDTSFTQLHSRCDSGSVYCDGSGGGLLSRKPNDKPKGNSLKSLFKAHDTAFVADHGHDQITRPLRQAAAYIQSLSQCARHTDRDNPTSGRFIFRPGRPVAHTRHAPSPVAPFVPPVVEAIPHAAALAVAAHARPSQRTHSSPPVPPPSSSAHLILSRLLQWGRVAVCRPDTT